MLLRSISAPLWFTAALVPMVASQILRLQQSNPATWILWDYTGRLGALAVLGAIPSARTVTFRWERLRLAWWEAALWIVGIVLADHYLGGWFRRTGTQAFDWDGLQNRLAHVSHGFLPRQRSLAAKSSSVFKFAPVNRADDCLLPILLQKSGATGAIRQSQYL
jgi:hypothetical protein